MTPSDLETAVAKTGHDRLRWLVSDANPDAASRDNYRRLVARVASGSGGESVDPPEAEGPVVNDLAETMSQLDQIKACPFFSRPEGCGCDFGRCLAKGGKRTTFKKCVDCLSNGGPQPRAEQGGM